MALMELLKKYTFVRAPDTEVMHINIVTVVKDYSIVTLCACIRGKVIGLVVVVVVVNTKIAIYRDLGT